MAPCRLMAAPRFADQTGRGLTTREPRLQAKTTDEGCANAQEGKFRTAAGRAWRATWGRGRAYNDARAGRGRPYRGSVHARRPRTPGLANEAARLLPCRTGPKWLDSSLNPHHDAGAFARTSLGRQFRRPGSWRRIMAPQGLKSGARKVLLGGNCNQPFQNFTGGADAASPIVMPRLDPGIHDETRRVGAY